MYFIEITKPAENDLHKAIDYISLVLKAPEAAKKLTLAVEQTLKSLQTNPFLYKLLDDDILREKNIRSVLIKNYLLFYRISEIERKLYVVRFLYARRNWKKLLVT